LKLTLALVALLTAALSQPALAQKDDKPGRGGGGASGRRRDRRSRPQCRLHLRPQRLRGRESPAGYQYARVANDILLMAVGARMITSAIADLSAM
jgi:hypothetical protein